MSDPTRLVVSDDGLTAGGHHARFGDRGQYGWWIGVLRRWNADVWECGHQHSGRRDATDCAQRVLDVVRCRVHEPILWRPGKKRSALGVTG